LARWHRRRESPGHHPRRHPDPGIEIRLEAIRALQRTASRQEGLIGTYHDEIRNAHREQDHAGKCLRILTMSRAEFADAIAASGNRVSAAQAQIDHAEQAIAAAHAEIARQTAALSESDLAFL
jgi:predicted  nucleic acid-binding Zn-ribbon protein